MSLRVSLKAFLILVAALSTLGLGLAVLIGHPTNEVDLLAGACLATAFGFLAAIFPEDRP